MIVVTAADMAPKRKNQRGWGYEARRLEAKAKKSGDIKFVKGKRNVLQTRSPADLRQKLILKAY